jgi:hypothetical protein
VKNTVPPATFAPLPVVGDVRPGPVVGTEVGALAELPPLPPELPLLLEEPQPATTRADRATPATTRRLLLMLLIYTVLQRLVEIKRRVHPLRDVGQRLASICPRWSL